MSSIERPAMVAAGGCSTANMLFAAYICSRVGQILPIIVARKNSRLSPLNSTGIRPKWELMPLWRRLREILLGSPRLFVDETRAPVLDPGRGRTKTGYFWSIARDDSAWRGDTGPPAVVYTYAPGRGAEHAT